ncbi:1-deoxy-D-xylulose-5-phosphate synthase N-terminal domain-containing protein [Rhizobium sp. YJ-22]|uniref:transketolase n=1 Tax=Rhizobium sp. YJ-22 TaxID=3037556 RepID=UPI0024125F88|nr:1-deoxy-D-xylulose-5-phosphate synthase N-terminal domain-containing protein [Rhizobium sp. YJ-22]MDG3578176.1 1-deoxy-D-xylulose-5-phosphate synthase N-terminal domain-containing protein [Rhizobium sp. YJ-22]
MNLQNQKTTEDIALGIRRRVFFHTMKNNGGYLSQACSAAESLALLYNELLTLGEPTLPKVPLPFAGVPSAHNPDAFTGAGYHGPAGPEYDRFIISPAHYALVIYSALIETGRMDEQALDLFNKDGGSVEMIGAEHSPGMEVTTGSLAQGLSMASGIAWARARNKEPGKVWVYMSDGEFQEGQTWECLAAMSYHKIDNIRVIVDVNRQQCDGAMSSVLDLGDLAARVSAFGVTCRSVDGHDLNVLRDAAASAEAGKPLVILANTSPYQGMDFLKKRFPRLHYVRFKSADERLEMQAALAAELGIDAADLQERA